MKYITSLITIFFITLLSSPSWSETMEDLVERNGLYYKKFTNVPFTGEIVGRETGKFKNGQKEGSWETHFGIGEIEKGNFKLGKKDGFWIEVGLSTGFKNQGNYIDGVKEGRWEQYFDYDGILSRVVHYKNGLLDGVVKEYHSNGNLISNVIYKNKCLDGIGEFFHSNGQIKSRGMYKKPKKDCFRQGFGSAEFEGVLMYQNGNKDGLWEYFNEDGTLEKTETYKDGVKQ